MNFAVLFYRTRNDDCPMVAFLDRLRLQQPELHKLLIAGLEKLRNSERHGLPLTRQVDARHKIYEVRVGGANIARAFFYFRHGQQIIVTNGYVKKTAKVDVGELDTAIRYKTDWEARFP